jgi:hypothetical protein
MKRALIMLFICRITPVRSFSLRVVAKTIAPIAPANKLSTLPARLIHQRDNNLHFIAQKASRKIPGSLEYYKFWRKWSYLVLHQVRSELSNTLPVPVDFARTRALAFSLGVAADQGRMPSFQGQGARAGYALNYFCRAQLLADILFHDAHQPAFFAHALQTLFSRETTVRVTSLGGATGYDFVAAAMMASFRNVVQQQPVAATNVTTGTSIHATVLDYEEGWSDLVDCMFGATTKVLDFDATSNHVCTFGGTCDITKSLHHASNAACRTALATTHIWTTQYCVAENAAPLRTSDFVFFRDLFEQSNNGSLFVFTETTHRIWPELVELVTSSNCFQAAFVKSGRSRTGYQLLMLKRQGENDRLLDEISEELMADFVRDREMHEQKMAGGHERQRKKIRGAKQ